MLELATITGTAIAKRALARNALYLGIKWLYVTPVPGEHQMFIVQKWEFLGIDPASNEWFMTQRHQTLW